MKSKKGLIDSLWETLFVAEKYQNTAIENAIGKLLKTGCKIEDFKIVSNPEFSTLMRHNESVLIYGRRIDVSACKVEFFVKFSTKYSWLRDEMSKKKTENEWRSLHTKMLSRIRDVDFEWPKYLTKDNALQVEDLLRKYFVDLREILLKDE